MSEVITNFDQLTISLINGTFTKSELKETLLSLLDKKITFHNIKNFREMEMFGKEDESSLKRVKELKKERERLINFFNGMEEGVEIEATSSVEIKVKGGDYGS